MTRDLRTMWKDAEPEDEEMAGLFGPHTTGPSCPPPELLQASQMRTLPQPVQARVARHVEHCVMCQALGEALDDPALASLTPEESARILTRVRAELGRSRRPFVAWWQFAAAAAAVALVAFGLVLFRASRNAPAALAPGEIAVLQLEKPDLPARTGTDLVWRGPTDSGAGADLGRALEPYRAGDFAEAARRLTALLDRQPQNPAVLFYLGVSDLFLGADAQAVTALEQAESFVRDDVDLARETAWYLALAYQRTGQIQRATAKLDALCRGGSTRAARACIGLSGLSAPQ
jgi:tetratricopeptide (TPR) repeat protein